MNVRNWFIAGLFLALTLPCAGCKSTPFWPSAETRQFKPLPQYESWYAEAEQCRGLKGNFDRLRFFIVMDEQDRVDEFIAGNEDGIIGLTSEDRIFILSGLENNKPLVVHEMLHNILSYHISKKANAAHDDSLSFYGPNACDLSE